MKNHSLASSCHVLKSCRPPVLIFRTRVWHPEPRVLSGPWARNPRAIPPFRCRHHIMTTWKRITWQYDIMTPWTLVLFQKCYIKPLDFMPHTQLYHYLLLTIWYPLRVSFYHTSKWWRPFSVCSEDLQSRLQCFFFRPIFLSLIGLQSSIIY